MENPEEYKGENFDTIEGAWDWHSRAIPETVYSPEELKYLMGEQIMFKKDFEDATTKLLSHLQPADNDYAVKESQWVSVNDRLPGESGLVEICLADTQDIYIAHYKKHRKLFQVWGAGRDPIIDMKTTHWKPMPKPPMHVCRELDCDNKATKEEYPGNSYFVCDECYKKLHPITPNN